MSDHRRVRFTRFSAPYHEGELAGFPLDKALDLVGRGVAVFDPADTDNLAVALAAMTRAQLVAYAREHFGLTDEPPEQVSDDDLRLALQQRAEQGPLPETSIDQLDAMDRVHLEAFAKTKLRFGDIDPDLTDDELRGQIRAAVEATASFTPPPKKAARSK